MRRHLRGILAVSLAVTAVIVIAVSRIGGGGSPEAPADASPTPLATPAAHASPPGDTPAPAPSPDRTAPPAATPIPTRSGLPTSAPTRTPPSTAPPAPTPTPTLTPTPTPTPTPAPPTAAAMAMATLAGDRGLPGGELRLLEYEPAEWRTSLLGCPGSVDPKAGKTYSAALTPGWRLLISHGDDIYEYHTDQAGTRIVTCDEHAPPGPDTANVAEETGLAGTESVEIARFDPATEAYRTVAIVEDPEEVVAFVNLLDLDMPLEPQVLCDPVMRIDYVAGSRTETLWFWCGRDVHVIHGPQGFWAGRRGIVAEEYATLIGPYAAMLPLPGFPPK